MRTQQQAFAGRSFLTTYDMSGWKEGDEAVWTPLRQVATLVRQAPRLPQFHPGEFMFMAAVANTRQRVRIYLYKHIDTRCYLNLDDGGHAYAYQRRVGDPMGGDHSGRYRRYTNLEDALVMLDLDAFEEEGLFRSFPPEEWAAHPW